MIVNVTISKCSITIIYEEIWILAYSPDLWEKGHHDDVIPVHFGEHTLDMAIKDAHTFSQDDGMSVMKKW